MNKAQREKLSVIIPTYNVEDLIAQAIRSVQWADEIFVVDSFSTDKTVEIAKKMGARVVQHEYIYSAKQKNWAIPQAKYDWILLLDSDEVVTPELRKTFEKLLNNPKELQKYDGFGIARKHYFFGKFLRWGGRYPLYNIRLFRKTCRYEDRDVHAHIVLPKERIKNIPGDILHYSDRTLEQFFEKFNRYSTYQANYMLKVHQQGLKGFNWKESLNPFYIKAYLKDIWQFLPFTPTLRFLYMYIFRLGFLDGRYGFMIALLYAFQDYVSRTKYLELTGKKPTLRLLIQRKMLARVHRIKSIEKNGLKRKYNSNLSIVDSVSK